ncbi:transcriptional regulator, AraC family [Sphingobacterium spiritivorum ATCC 33300]|uniref:Transcriptional regulator, AraC family n=1 Tax=Sphingobacterium spiritivorum ATCC 33300 TaxID=525372 RepID=C2G3P3_SPHSI|nr:helix-turn-helix domain-containing protein [Sphingobacterium spiritivorum]EEI90248.1 transcriptional regulator, AraC family [Sphingobacterium spiritivorum ATCC 33300]QQS95121.1 helix-turn-helix domain-containing protein [Sphingobacterium spiritivorum]
MQISVFVPQYGTIEGITPAFRTFHTANEFLTVFGKKPVFEVEYVGLQEYVPANSGEYSIRTNRLLQDVSRTDLLIIPPVFGSIDSGIAANAEAIPYFTRLYMQGTSLASLCVGAFLLAETGLLSGKKCSTHWAYINEFKEKYPDIEIEDGAVITAHDNIYSSGGASSLWNLILYLVEKYSDRETAVLIAKYFALDISRDSQSQFAIFRGQRNHDDADIQKVQDYVEKHYEDKITIDDLANLSSMGRRTFERRFKEATNNTPVEYIQRVRIEAAKKFFEASRKNVSEVMYDVGYSDTKAFRDIFKKITGLTPIEYRNKFAKVTSEI